jgi:hypothetical protein
VVAQTLKSGPASTEANVPTVTARLGLDGLVPHAFPAVTEIFLEPVVAELPTVTVIELVLAPEVIDQPGGKVQL